MWATLYRNNAIYQANLAQAIAWIQKYFAQDEPVAKSDVRKSTRITKNEYSQ